MLETHQTTTDSLASTARRYRSHIEKKRLAFPPLANLQVPRPARGSDMPSHFASHSERFLSKLKAQLKQLTDTKSTSRQKLQEVRQLEQLYQVKFHPRQTHLHSLKYLRRRAQELHRQRKLLAACIHIQRWWKISRIHKEYFFWKTRCHLAAFRIQKAWKRRWAEKQQTLVQQQLTKQVTLLQAVYRAYAQRETVAVLKYQAKLQEALEMAREIARSRQEAATQTILQACHAYLAKCNANTRKFPGSDQGTSEKPVHLLNSRRGLNMKVNTHELHQTHRRQDSASAKIPAHSSPVSVREKLSKPKTTLDLRPITEE